MPTILNAAMTVLAIICTMAISLGVVVFLLSRE